MNPDTIPLFADIKPTVIALVLLLEFLFGLGYNIGVAYLMKHHLMHVSWTVVLGVTGTLLIPSAFWFDHSFLFWQTGILLMGCFTASGIPMIVGSTKRSVREQKKRRPIGNAAARIRDDAVMEVTTIIQDIVQRSKARQLDLNDLIIFMDRLHSVIGMLKSI